MDGPKQWMQQTLRVWLQKTNWTTDELIGFLQGYELPPVGHDEEPHIWLVRGLPSNKKARRIAVWQLTRRVIVLLDSEPDVTRPGRRPDQVLYNLLMLSTDLQQRELAEPLHRLYLRHIARNTLGEHKWLGLQHTARLRDALTVNQTDGRYKNVWLTMLKSKQTTLPGFPSHGFYGMLYMPTHGSNRLSNMGLAIKLFAKAVEHEADRTTQLEWKIKHVRQSLSGTRNLDKKLRLVARVYNWPQWVRNLLQA